MAPSKLVKGIRSQALACLIVLACPRALCLQDDVQLHTNTNPHIETVSVTTAAANTAFPGRITVNMSTSTHTSHLANVSTSPRQQPITKPAVDPTPKPFNPFSGNPGAMFQVNRFKSIRKGLKAFYKTINATLHPTLVTCAGELIKNLDDLFCHNCSSGAAFQLFDSWGQGLGDPGSYTECIGAPGDARYCSIGASIYINDSVMTMGVCMPSQCLESDINVVVPLTLFHDDEFVSVSCYPRPEEPKGYTAFIAFIIILCVLMALATLSDMAVMTWGCFATDADPDEFDVFEAEKFLPAINDDEDSGRLGSTSSYFGNTQAGKVRFDERVWRYYPDGTSTGVLGLLIDAWSIPRAFFGLIFARPRYAATLRVFDGLKVMSMVWILSGQTVLLMLPAIQNKAPLYLMSGPDHPFVSLIFNASLGTDTLLFVGGFLAMYKTLMLFSRRAAPKGWRAVKLVLSSILRRYLRLTPLLGLTMACYLVLMPTLAQGPYWPDWIDHPDYAACKDSWWTNLLYVNNLVNPHRDVMPMGCMGWTWYLAVDMQLHVLAPIVALMFWHWGLSAIVATLLMIVASIASTAAEVAAHDIEACSAELDAWTNPHPAIYVTPWTRAVPYLFGFLLAFWLNAMGGAVGAANITRAKCSSRCILASLAMVFMLLPLFGTIHMHYGDSSGDELEFDDMGVYGRCRWSKTTGQVYLTLFRTSWSLGLFVLALICLSGWGGWVTSIFALESWTPLSRLVYGVYLIHPLIMEVFAYGAQRQLMFSVFSYMNWYAGFTALSFLFSMMQYLIFEGPFLRILRSLLPFS